MFSDNLKRFIVLNDGNKKLFKNFAALSIVQISNYVLPLITLPYLVRVIGPSNFGLVAFAQAFVQYFVLLSDYGFNFTATKEISVNKDNKEKVSKIFSSVIFIKLIFMILGFGIMCAIVYSITKFSADHLIYIFSFGMVIGKVMFPVWFFQGMEKMAYITIVNFIAKLSFIPLIFIFVRRADDFIRVPALQSFGYILAGIIALYIVFFRFKVKFIFPTKEDIFHELKEGWHVFLSTLAISLYTVSNTFILGIFTNNAVVGYYSAAEKIVRAFQSLIMPISQTLYPHISALAASSRKAAKRFIRKALKPIALISFIFSCILFLFAKQFVLLALGTEYSSSIVLMRILAFVPFVVALSNVFGIQTMLTFNYKKEFSRVLIMASCFNISLALLLVGRYRAVGISIAVMFTEIFVTFMMYLFLKRRRIV